MFRKGFLRFDRFVTDAVLYIIFILCSRNMYAVFAENAEKWNTNRQNLPGVERNAQNLKRQKSFAVKIHEMIKYTGYTLDFA